MLLSELQVRDRFTFVYAEYLGVWQKGFTSDLDWCQVYPVTENGTDFGFQAWFFKRKRVKKLENG